MRKFSFSVLLFSAGYGLVFLHFLAVPGTISRQAVVITRNTPFKDVTKTLGKEGIITNRFHFRTLAAILRATRRIEAGEYEFNRPLRPLKVLTMLTQGDVKKYYVTIPEGATLRQAADLVAQSGLAEARQILSGASDPALIRSLGCEGSTLEGYIFPETYELTKGLTPDQILETFVARFKLEFTDEMERRAREIGMTPRQVLILASIIEREAKKPEERPMISAVFHNRLKRGMPLQADPTVMYGLGETRGRLRKIDLVTDTPYNTYLHRGLPPGPIGNPGLPSIQAALHPAGVPFLYFVSRNDGSHVFSSTLKEHNKYVNKFQRGTRSNRGS